MGTELCEIQPHEHYGGYYFEWVIGLQYGQLTIGSVSPCRKLFLGLF